jgi:hypothetical protein
MVDPIAFLTLSQNRKTSTINVWTMIEHGEYITEVWSALYFGGLYGGLYFERVWTILFSERNNFRSLKSMGPYGIHMVTWSSECHCLFSNPSILHHQPIMDCIMLSRTITIITKHLLTILTPTFFAFISHEQPFWTNGHLGYQSLAHSWMYCNRGQVLEPPVSPRKDGDIVTALVQAPKLAAGQGRPVPGAMKTLLVDWSI